MIMMPQKKYRKGNSCLWDWGERRNRLEKNDNVIITVYDQAGGYFRIFQPKSIGSTKGTYLNLLGNEVCPAFKSKGGIKNIRLINVGKDIWQQFTHFLIE